MNATVKPAEGRIVHENVWAAIAGAMGEVRRISKDNKNTEQKYDFASVDDFMAMVGPICARHGLVTITDETDVEFIEKQGKYGPTFWVKIGYSITTYHESGSSTPTVRRNIEVIRSGPQAYGSAQSYILKQYSRGLLQIPTGDKDDPDFGRPEDQPIVDRREDKAAAHERAVTATIASIAKEPSLDSLGAFWADLNARDRGIASDGRVVAAKDKRKNELAKPADDLGGDSIPY